MKFKKISLVVVVFSILLVIVLNVSNILSIDKVPKTKELNEDNDITLSSNNSKINPKPVYISDSVYTVYTKEKYPEIYLKYPSRVEDFQKLREDFASLVIDTKFCDKVLTSDISLNSLEDNLEIQVVCKKEDLDDVHLKITEKNLIERDASSISM